MTKEQFREFIEYIASLTFYYQGLQDETTSFEERKKLRKWLDFKRDGLTKFIVQHPELTRILEEMLYCGKDWFN